MFAFARAAWRSANPATATPDWTVRWQELRLQGIARGRAKDEALASGILGGQYRARRTGHDQDLFVRLEHVQRLGGNAGVAETDGRDDVLLQHQVLCHLQAEVRSGLVIAHHEFEWSSKIPADLVHFVDRDLSADARAVAHVR